VGYFGRMRLLCLSDIHGQATALERALALGKLHGCAKVLVAGDLCFPGPEPLRTWMLLTAERAQCVQGLSDKALATVDPDKLVPSTPQEIERVERLRATRDQLGEVILARLDKLPTSFRMAVEDGGEILLVHGSPVDHTTSITHDMTDSEISALLGDEPADTVICGGSHVPFDRTVGTTRVINVGSVGESPAREIAHATIITTSSAGVEVHPLQIPLWDPEQA
jgi:predicted phosphodiesterase